MKRKAYNKAKDILRSLKKIFYEIKSIVTIDEIPDELILNFDQTALSYVPVTPWTMEEEGAKRVDVLAIDDKRQITAWLDDRRIFPLQLIYEGKTN